MLEFFKLKLSSILIVHELLRIEICLSLIFLFIYLFIISDKVIIV